MSDSDCNQPSGESDTSAVDQHTDALRVDAALATRMLPLISRIVADLRTAWFGWRAAVTRYDAAFAALRSEPESPLVRRAEEDVQMHAAAVEALREELRPLGAVCLSPRTGRVEWHTVRDGVAELLFWEPGLSHVSSDALDVALHSINDDDGPTQS